jgi:hypothetical protein
MRAFMVSFLLATSGYLLGQKSPHTSSPNSDLKTYTSRDGTFRFTYPNLLIRCQLSRQKNTDEYYWGQPECDSYHPVCGDLLKPDEPEVCIAYPRNHYTRSAYFEAAAFSVSETMMTEKECLGNKPGQAKLINGVKFHAVHEADGGMNQVRRSKGFVTFHGGRCYGIGITVTTVVSGSIDPREMEPTKQDWNQIYGELNQARDSFRFLK